MNQTQQSVLFLIIFVVWASFIYIRTFDKTLKKYISSLGMLLAFWMIIRIAKTYTHGIYTFYFWYLYYIPLLLIPTIYYNCSNYIINKKSKKARIVTIVISIVLFLLVITNNLHNLVFKLTEDPDDYTHNIGYFIIVAWILGLIIIAIKNLIKLNKEKKNKNVIALSTLILLGVLYTFLYVKNVPIVRHTNMSVIIGALFCMGIELLFDVKLIPNNYKYKKIFKNSHLPLEIISNDGKMKIKTNYNIDIENNIIEDIENGKCKKIYKTENKVQNVERIKGGYAIEEKDLSEIHKLEEKLQLTNKELLRQEKILQKYKKIKSEIYETKVKNEIVELLDETIEEKRNLITKMLDEMQTVDFKKMQKIKLLINYCKRMSSLVISNYNKEIYNNERLGLILNELLEEKKASNVNGVLQMNNFEITSSETVTIYESVFEIISDLKNVDFILNIQVNAIYIEIKYVFDCNLNNLKNKLEELQFKKIIEVEEKTNDDETVLKLKMLRGEN